MNDNDYNEIVKLIAEQKTQTPKTTLIYAFCELFKAVGFKFDAVEFGTAIRQAEEMNEGLK